MTRKTRCYSSFDSLISRLYLINRSDRFNYGNRTSNGRAIGNFAEFEREILRERVKEDIAYARNKGKTHVRPATTKNMSKK